ncbi:HEAT repeat domain-containing protein [Micromonospora sp. NPDC004704]
MASDTSAAVRADLATALGGCTWTGARPLITTLTQDPDHAVRARATVALTRIS